ncbi:MAG: fasciclin domain-containing protein [Balneolaceae bacterium]|nr:fasciclin domain-containing protein [Balneolaceae bacterium]
MSELLVVSELDSTITDDGPYTVIAPTDEAFRDHGLDVEELKSNPDMAHDLLVNHIFEGEVFSQDVENSMNITLTDKDIIALNGIVHVTDIIIEDE